MRTLSRRPQLSLAAGALFLMAATGCVFVDKDDKPEAAVEPGQLEVIWTFGGRTCGEADVAAVSASLVDTEGRIYARTEATCESGRAMIGPVAPGVYELIVDGSSRDGIVTHNGGMSAVVIDEATTTRPDKLNLKARGSLLQLAWRFANGNLCSFNGVTEVTVAVFDNLGREVHLMNYACDPAEPVGIPNVPAGYADVYATALDVTGNPRARDVERIETSFGTEVPVQLVLEDCDKREDSCI